MLVQLGVNQGLAKCHSLASLVPGSIVLWNGSKYELVSQSKTQNKLCVAFIANGATLFGLNAWTAWSSGDLGMGILSGFLSVSAAAAAASRLPFRENGSDCTAFLNGLLSIANERSKDKGFHQIVRPHLMGKLLFLSLVASQILYPWLFSFVALAWPCFPLNMFSSVIAWCGGGGGSNMLWLARAAIGLGTAAVHVVFYRALFSQGVMDCMHIVLGPLCHNTLLRLMSTRRLGLDDCPSQLKFYRSCQILNICFSNYCSVVTLAIIGSLIVSEIGVSYLVLKMLAGSATNLPLLIKVTVIGLLPTFYLLHVMTIGEAGAVNTVSISVLSNMMQRNVRSNRLTRRQLLSAWPLKIKLGRCNFIEAATALILLDFTLRRLVDLLLIEG